MAMHEFGWRTADELKIYGQYWAPEKDIKGVVCLVHGHGEHIARYEPIAQFLNQSGYALIGYDLRGHGRSGGKKGHTPSYERLLHEVDDLLGKAEEFFPEIPQVLYGHSMGGNIVLNYVLDRKPQLAGVIATSPWLKLAFEPPALQVKMGKLVNHIFPSFTQTSKLDTKAISRIEEEVKKYENDELVHDSISTMLFFSIYEQGLWALDHAAEFHLPLLICHGTADRITSPEATREFASKVKGDVTLKMFEGSFHEIHNDLDRQELLQSIKSWLDSHLVANK